MAFGATVFKVELQIADMDRSGSRRMRWSLRGILRKPTSA